MKLKQTREPVIKFACANLLPEPPGSLTWCYVPIVVLCVLFSGTSNAEESEARQLLDTLRERAAADCYQTVEELNLWSEALSRIESPGEPLQKRFAVALSNAMNCAADLSDSASGATYSVTKDMFGSGYSLSKNGT